MYEVQLLKHKKPRKNFRKGQKSNRWIRLLGRIVLGFKVMAAVVTFAAVTGFFILIHELVTQCDYFAAEKITIEGTQRLTHEQVARQARIRNGDNILSVNLSLVRRRLLAHPWIAEAEVSREIPSRLIIRVKEHTALAVVDFGQKFLIDHQGRIFKAWNPADPHDLPVISGLDLSDLKIYGRLEPSYPDQTSIESAPFRAVMQVLELGKQQGSILPNHLIRQISVDRQIGLTIYAFDRLKAISLGYSDYIGKYHMLAKLFSYLKRQRSIFDFDRIDLNNMKRIVVNPIKNEFFAQKTKK
jgi:cell division protein FtsQ